MRRRTARNCAASRWISDVGEGLVGRGSDRRVMATYLLPSTSVIMCRRVQASRGVKVAGVHVWRCPSRCALSGVDFESREVRSMSIRKCSDLHGDPVRRLSAWRETCTIQCLTGIGGQESNEQLRHGKQTNPGALECLRATPSCDLRAFFQITPSFAAVDGKLSSRLMIKRPKAWQIPAEHRRLFDYSDETVTRR